MIVDQTDERIVFMKKEDVLKASGLCNVLKDRWFIVHAETESLVFWQDTKKRKGSLIGASPLCNSSETVISRMIPRYPWAKSMFFERVIYPIDIKDYT